MNPDIAERMWSLLNTYSLLQNPEPAKGLIRAELEELGTQSGMALLDVLAQIAAKGDSRTECAMDLPLQYRANAEDSEPCPVWRARANAV